MCTDLYFLKRILYQIAEIGDRIDLIEMEITQ